MRKKRFISLYTLLSLAIIAAFICSACNRSEERLPGLISSPSPTLQPTPVPTPEKTPKPDRQRRLTKFSEMEYYRPNAVEIAYKVDKLTSNINEYNDIDELERDFDVVDELYMIYDRMYAIAMIRASMDRSDDYWVEEERVLLEGYPTLDKASGALIIALYESKHRAAIEEYWDEYFFRYIENAYFTNDVTKPLYEREAVLESEQKERLAKASIKYKGNELTYNDIQALEDYYDWMDASLIWYKQYNEEFASRYIELVKTRNAIAEALDFESYADYSLQYRHKDYTSDMMRSLIDDIAENLVPLYSKILRIGRYRPEPEMSYDEFLDFFGDTLSGMDVEMGEVLDIMIEYELVDMEPRAYKDGGAFTMYISDYEVPFILGTYTRDLYSMITLAHEFGHFYYTYATMIDPPANNDLSEVHSQSMELFLANHFKDALGDDMGYQMLFDSLFRTFTTITGQPYYASLELRAYSLSADDLTVDNLNSIALEEARRFGMGAYFPEYAMYDWTTVPHIYHNPMTTFGYVTSALVTAELWETSIENEDEALAMYLKTIHREKGTEFIDVVEAAGLTSPFEEGRTDWLAQWAQEYLIDEKLK